MMLAPLLALLLTALMGGGVLADGPTYGKKQPRMATTWIQEPEFKVHNFELGVFGGYGWQSTFQWNHCEGCPEPDGLSRDAWNWGGFAGYLYRPDASWGVGLEADAMRLYAEGALAEWVMSLRGRGGFYVTPGIFAYGTGGAAWDVKGGRTGWVAGGGLEFNPTQNTAVRFEVLHYDFDKDVCQIESFDVAKVGISYKF